VTGRGGRPSPSNDSEAGAAAIVGASAAVLTLVALDVGGIVRVVLVVGYLLVVPGLAAVRTAGFAGFASLISLSIVLSIGIVGVVAMALYAGQRFEPVLALTLVVAVTMGLVFLERLIAPTRPLTQLDPRSPDPGVAPTQR
jgi:hypothetical protein